MLYFTKVSVCRDKLIPKYKSFEQIINLDKMRKATGCKIKCEGFCIFK